MEAKWDSFTCLTIILISLVLQLEEILNSSNVPWTNNDVTRVRTKLKNVYDLYMQSKIQEHRDKYNTYKKEYNVVIKN
jgi:hypothetical protein